MSHIIVAREGIRDSRRLLPGILSARLIHGHGEWHKPDLYTHEIGQEGALERMIEV